MLNMRLHSDQPRKRKPSNKPGTIVMTTKLNSRGRFIPAGHYDANGNFVKHVHVEKPKSKRKEPMLNELLNGK